MKLFISRIRLPSGKWVVDPDPRSKKETEQFAKLNRIYGGFVTQVWPMEEAISKGWEINRPEES